MPPPTVTNMEHDERCRRTHPVGAGAPVGHTECVRAIVSQRGVELVLKLPAPDALAAHPCARGVPRLDHEALIGKKEIM